MKTLLVLVMVCGTLCAADFGYDRSRWVATSNGIVSHKLTLNEITSDRTPPGLSIKVRNVLPDEMRLPLGLSKKAPVDAEVINADAMRRYQLQYETHRASPLSASPPSLYPSRTQHDFEKLK